jgi:hypothetical protein
VEQPAPLLQPFTKQPYCGMLLFHLLFEEYSSEVHLMRQAIKNMTVADYKQRMYLMPGAYTDVK